MKNEMISFLNLSDNYNDVLIVGDTNYFIDDNFDVEIIAKNEVSATNYLNIDDFMNKKKRTFNYKYKRIIIEENYLDYLDAIKYLLDDSFKAIIILDKDYYIEDNTKLVNLIYQDQINTEIIKHSDYIMILCEKTYDKKL